MGVRADGSNSEEAGSVFGAEAGWEMSVGGRCDIGDWTFWGKGAGVGDLGATMQMWPCDRSAASEAWLL